MQRIMWKSLSRFSLSGSRRLARKLSSSRQASKILICPEKLATFLPGLDKTPHFLHSRFISNQSAVPSDLDLPTDIGVEEISATGLPSTSSNEDSDETPAYVIDQERVDSVLRLLEGSVDSSLESSLDNMNLTLYEDFVIKVLESPAISGENLIKFVKWVSDSTDFSVTVPLMRGLARSVLSIQEDANPRKIDVYALWDLVQEIGRKHKRAALDVGILNELIASLSKLGKSRAALQVFDNFDSFECIPDSLSYYLTIESLCKRPSYDSAWSVCERMIASGNLPVKEQIGNIVCWLCKGKMAKSAHTLYLAAKEKTIDPPPSAVTTLVTLLCKEGETVKLAADILDDFEGESRKYAVKVFSAVVHGLCRAGELDGARTVLNGMISQGPPPGNAVFNTLINGFSKAKDMEAAIKLKKLMENRGLKPDLYTYTVIMSGFVSEGQIEEALKVLSDAKKKHSTLNPVMYHTLIRGFCKREEFDKALGLLSEMKDFGVNPNVDEYNKLIQSLCLKALDWETAEVLLDEMRGKGLHLNGITKALIKATKEMETEAMDTLETAVEA